MVVDSPVNYIANRDTHVFANKGEANSLILLKVGNVLKGTIFSGSKQPISENAKFSDQGNSSVYELVEISTPDQMNSDEKHFVLAKTVSLYGGTTMKHGVFGH